MEVPSQNNVNTKANKAGENPTVMTMVKVEDESRALVEGKCGNILGCGGVVDGDGGEEHLRVEIAGNGTLHGTIAGSVAGEGGFSAEKPIHEARYV